MRRHAPPSPRTDEVIARARQLLTGNVIARVAGTAIAMISAILDLVFLSAYPRWSAVVITLDVIAIYAIVVHGRELEGHDVATPGPDAPTPR